MKTMIRMAMMAVVAVSFGAFAQASALNCPAGTKLRSMKTDKNMNESICMRVTDGMCHGPTQATFDSGKVRSNGACVNGRMSGHWTYFDEQGHKAAEIDFKDGNYHGTRVEYFVNGQKRFEETWTEGRQQGPTKFFDAMGKPSTTLVTTP